MELKDLAGKHVLEGVDIVVHYLNGEKANSMILLLGGVCYAFVEDPEDGYRSCLDRVEVLHDHKMVNTFVPHLVNVTHIDDDCKDALVIKDILSDSIVIEVGTWMHDEYYPTFVSSWEPKNLAVNKGK